MNIFIYFSTYIIFGGFLYYFKLIKYNPFLWLVFALFVSFCIMMYLIINDKANYYELIKYSFYNSPKLLLLLILDKKSLFEGFIFYAILFILYYFILYQYKSNLYDIYYTKTILKLMKNDF
jgi:hypothetical protein